MPIQRLNPTTAPGPRGDYSLVSISAPGSPLVFVAGQTGRRTDGSIDPDPRIQTLDVFANLKAVLEAVDSGPEGIVHLRSYIVGRAVLDAFFDGRSAVFESWFDRSAPPTNTLAIVSGLSDADALVEVEAVACLPGASRDGSFDNPLLPE